MEMCRKESEDEKKREEVDWFALLPDDIVIHILKRVDAFLCYKAMYVCRRWFNLMITNRILLDRASIIIQNTKKFTARIVDIGEEGQGHQVKEQSLEIPCRGVIRSWCNEFLLISDDKKLSLYVYNLITKEGSYLPECNASCGEDHYIQCGVALSFDEFKGIYKVVHLFIGSTIQCDILILGKDAVSPVTSKWKKIQVPNMIQDSLFIVSNINPYRCCEPISVQGRYLHWQLYYHQHLVSVDMVKEEIFDISLPHDKFYDRTFIVMGGFLTLMVMDDCSGHKPGIWVLKDFHKVKWEKLQSVYLNTYYFERIPGKPIVYRVVGMISKRYMILKCISEYLLLRKEGLFSYDLENGALKSLDVYIEYEDERCVVHSSAHRWLPKSTTRKN